MKIITFVFCTVCAVAPVWADQEQDPAPSLMEEGARLFFEGLQQEFAPALEGMQALALEMGPALQDFIQQMGPAMADVLDQVEDWSQYQAPEILPNGDIIMRKKSPEERSPDMIQPDETDI